MPSTSLVYLATETGLKVLSYVGNHWRVTPTALAGKDVLTILVSAQNPARLLAAVAGEGVYLSETNGAEWQRTLTANPCCMLADAVNADRLWVGVTPAGVYRSLDGGFTWGNLTNAIQNIPGSSGWEGSDSERQPAVACLAQPVDGGDKLIAGIQVGGLLKSEDAGDSWQTADDSPADDVHALLQQPADPAFWLAATGDGVYRSADNAESWELADEGIAEFFTGPVVFTDSAVALVAAVAAAPGNWVENAVSSLYRSTDKAQTWQSVVLPTPEYITALAADPYHARRVYLGTQRGLVYVSHDLGQTWQFMLQSEGAIRAVFCLRLG